MIDKLIEDVTKTITGYRYPNVHSENGLQRAVAEVLAMKGFTAPREVIEGRGRYDIVVECDGARLVLELKIKGSAAEAERQSQGYLLLPSVDAVLLCTTSARLAASIAQGSTSQTMPGPSYSAANTVIQKPFRVVLLRSTL